MKKLRALALSDLHLGKKNALLSENKFGMTDTTIEKIRELSTAGPDANFESGIEELILLGDIVDLSEASDIKAYEILKNFLTKFLGSVNVDKIIFIPGNHDHHLWLRIVCNDDISEENYIEKIAALPQTIMDPPIFLKSCMPNSTPPVKVCYPYYSIDEVDEEHTSDNIKIAPQYFLFDHGHLFSALLKKLSKCFIIRSMLGFEKSTTDVKTLKELELAIWRFIETIWHPNENKLQRMRAKIWDMYQKIKLTLKFNESIPTTFREDYRSVLRGDLIRQIQWYLSELCILHSDCFYKRDFHLIFGHTHLGGRVLKDDRKIRIKGSFISIWNTGGWIVPSRTFSPDACIFYIERNKDRLVPNMYKLVKVVKSDGKPPVGDYDKRILYFREKG